MQLIWLVMVIGIALVCWGRLRRSGRPGDANGPIPLQVQRDRIRPRDQLESSRARFKAAYAHRAEQLMSCIASVTAPIAVLLIIGSLTGNPPWQYVDEWQWAEDVVRFVTSLGLLTTVLTSAAIIAAASRMRTSEAARRHFGILWDLTTFWPRAAHPLAPPCYAERVVPEILTRVYWGLTQDEEHNRVVLSAHSQGSYLALAAVSRFRDPEDLKRVRLITYGCQLRPWYGRIFPGVFGPEDMGYRPTDGSPTFSEAWPDWQGSNPPDVPAPADPPAGGSLRDRLGGDPEDPHWINLFRRSDPLGFHVFADFDNTLDKLVIEVPPTDKGDPGPIVQGHGAYWHSDVYITHVGRWYQEIPPAGDPPSIVKDEFFPEA